MTAQENHKFIETDTKTTTSLLDKLSRMAPFLVILLSFLTLAQLFTFYKLYQYNQKFLEIEDTLYPGLKQLKAVDFNKDHIRGAKNPKIALIEYSDYDCPYCHSFHESAKQALKEYDTELIWVYRHFPLNIHPEAQKKGEAAECINELGGQEKFWQFTDEMMTGKYTNADLGPVVQNLGLNEGQFMECFNSGKYADRVLSDFNEGVNAQVNGTPGNFLVNLKTGKKVKLRGAVGIEELRLEIERLK